MPKLVIYQMTGVHTIYYEGSRGARDLGFQTYTIRTAPELGRELKYIVRFKIKLKQNGQATTAE